MIRRPPRSTPKPSSAASDVYKRQRVCLADPGQPLPWRLEPFLEGLTPQRNVVLFKTALASVLEPDSRLVQIYAEMTDQECPLEETPVERLKRAFQEFTESFEADQQEPV